MLETTIIGSAIILVQVVAAAVIVAAHPTLAFYVALAATQNYKFR